MKATELAHRSQEEIELLRSYHHRSLALNSGREPPVYPVMTREAAVSMPDLFAAIERDDERAA